MNRLCRTKSSQHHNISPFVSRWQKGELNSNIQKEEALEINAKDAFVMGIAQGHYNDELNVDSDVVFKTSNINNDKLDKALIDLSEQAFKVDVINMSSSSHSYSSELRGLKSLNDNDPHRPLKITSADNSDSTCTAKAAELGRTIGLSASDLQNHFSGVEQSE